MNHPERVLLEPFLVAGITARTNNAGLAMPDTSDWPDDPELWGDK